MKRLSTPLTKKKIASLKCSDEILLSGTIYTARDQAHKRLVALVKDKKNLPLSLKDKIIYYCGPTKSSKGKAAGSAGPTTSSRMDNFTPKLLSVGLKGMIGKGKRSEEVIDAIRKNKSIYFLTYAGCGALLSEKIMRSRVVAFKNLGPEAIYEFKVKDFPLIVAVDSKGRSIYGS